MMKNEVGHFRARVSSIGVRIMAYSFIELA